jgi:hypothetical protein
VQDLERRPHVVQFDTRGLAGGARPRLGFTHGRVRHRVAGCSEWLVSSASRLHNEDVKNAPG